MGIFFSQRAFPHPVIFFFSARKVIGDTTMRFLLKLLYSSNTAQPKNCCNQGLGEETFQCPGGWLLHSLWEMFTKVLHASLFHPSASAVRYANMKPMAQHSCSSDVLYMGKTARSKAI